MINSLIFGLHSIQNLFLSLWKLKKSTWSFLPKSGTWDNEHNLRLGPLTLPFCNCEFLWKTQRWRDRFKVDPSSSIQQHVPCSPTLQSCLYCISFCRIICLGLLSPFYAPEFLMILQATWLTSCKFLLCLKWTQDQRKGVKKWYKTFRIAPWAFGPMES